MKLKSPKPGIGTREHKKQSILYHKDFGKRGSEFIVHHPSFNNFGLDLICFSVVAAMVSFYIGISSRDNCVLVCVSALLCLVLILRFFLKISSEKVTILSSLGVQIESTFFFGNKSTHFIDVNTIKDIVINEGITMHTIIYYLVILLKNKQTGEVEQLYHLFSNSCLTLDDMKEIYRAAQTKMIQTKVS